MLNGALESNSDGVDINEWQGSPRISGGLNIFDEMAKTTTQHKLYMLAARYIFQAASGMNKDVLRKCHPSDMQYLESLEPQRAESIRPHSRGGEMVPAVGK